MILLDTHVLVWLVEGLPVLGKQAKKFADQAFVKDELAVSAMSFWEIALLHQRRRLILEQSIDVWRTPTVRVGTT